MAQLMAYLAILSPKGRKRSALHVFNRSNIRDRSEQRKNAYTRP